MNLPKEMSIEDIKMTIAEYREAARRAREARFDVIELHGAHGYLINQFLSPLSNKRTDEYGGSRENRYRFLREVIKEVKTVWNGPLFVRISAAEYYPEGNTMEDMIYFSKQMREKGVDLIDCSSGAIVPITVEEFPGYQVPLAEKIKEHANINTGEVGRITNATQAEEILKNNRADLIFIGRELLRDPYWPLRASIELDEPIDFPKSYRKAWIGILPNRKNNMKSLQVES